MTFKEYLVVRKARADEAGDFVRLPRRDPGVPDAATLDEVLAYLERGGNLEALAGAGVTWRKYVIAERDAQRMKMQKAQNA